MPHFSSSSSNAAHAASAVAAVKIARMSRASWSQYRPEAYRDVARIRGGCTCKPRLSRNGSLRLSGR